MNNLLPWI